MINWEDIFATFITDELGKNQTIQQEKMIKGQEKKIYSKKNTMAIKHEKKFLTLVIMKKMKSEVY